MENINRNDLDEIFNKYEKELKENIKRLTDEIEFVCTHPLSDERNYKKNDRNNKRKLDNIKKSIKSLKVKMAILSFSLGGVISLVFNDMIRYYKGESEIIKDVGKDVSDKFKFELDDEKKLHIFSKNVYYFQGEEQYYYLDIDLCKAIDRIVSYLQSNTDYTSEEIYVYLKSLNVLNNLTDNYVDQVNEEILHVTKQEAESAKKAYTYNKD